MFGLLILIKYSKIYYEKRFHTVPDEKDLQGRSGNRTQAINYEAENATPFVGHWL